MPNNTASTVEAAARTTMRLDITSETGFVNQVIVHTPGREMEMVSPENRANLLFEDILFLDDARREHEVMCQVLAKIVGDSNAVIQLTDLLADVLEINDARHDLVERLCKVDFGKNLGAYESELIQMSAGDLLEFVLTGKSTLNIDWWPLPNLMFTRDVAAVVGNHIIVSHPASAARARESVLVRTILDYHPGFDQWRGNVISLPQGVSFEGGDLLVANEATVLLGSSERTSFGGVMNAARSLLARTSVENVIIVNLPKQRSCMHLDTVFTFASPTECVVFPPLMDLTDKGNVVMLREGGSDGTFAATIKSNVKTALEECLGYGLEFIPCGGTDLLSQQREQWTDGANFFAMGPGVVIGYERNHRTFDIMNDRGYQVVSADAFLSYHSESEFQAGDRVAVKLVGNELSRGRGGPRCMTMPLCRTPLGQ